MNYKFFLIFGLHFLSCATVKHAGIQGNVYKNKADKSTLPYNIIYPDEYFVKVAKIPLFIWLHGTGERSDDNESQLIYIVPYLGSDLV